MSKLARVVGVALIAVSGLATIQTAREVALVTTGDQRYTEEYAEARSLSFGGHTLTAVDDQAYRPTTPERTAGEAHSRCGIT